MTGINLDELLVPVSDEAPAGEDLLLQAKGMELAALFRECVAADDDSRKAGTFRKSDTWQDALAKSVELFSRTKDYRVAVYLTWSAFEVNGFRGLADGIAAIRLLTERYWDSVYPLLDEDDGDPTIRINALMQLNDRKGLVKSIRWGPLLMTPQHGAISLRDVQIADGELDAAAPDSDDHARPQLDRTAIESAFAQVAEGEVREVHSAIVKSRKELASVRALIADYLENAGTPDFGGLIEVLERAEAEIATELSRRGVGAPVAQLPKADNHSAVGSKQPMAGSIGSRDDVIRALEKCCEYFERHEPSSPVPLLLNRAKRLVAASFMDILRDMTPDGVKQAEAVAGLERRDG